MEEQLSPALQAMREHMRLAEQAAEERQRAKAKVRSRQVPDLDDEDLRVIAETAIQHAVVEEEPELPPAGETFVLAEDDDLDLLVAQVSAAIPDLNDEDVHGDLVVKRHEARNEPWYKLAAEESLPETLKSMNGPADIKHVLHALMVEVGDVKRTNAILMEMLQRLEEKVDRTNRHLRERRPY
jgi:hypothetical protein